MGRRYSGSGDPTDEAEADVRDVAEDGGWANWP